MIVQLTIDYSFKKRIASLVLLVLSTSIAAVTVNVNAFDDEVVDRVLADLSSLPEKFDNNKLIAQPDEDPTCYKDLGCFDPVPVPALAADPEKLSIKFVFYDQYGAETQIVFKETEVCLQSDPSRCDNYQFDLQALLMAPYKSKSRTIILIGGYMSKAPSDWETHVRDIWLELEDVNVIIVDWHKHNSGTYYTAAANTRPVARQITILLYYLAKLTGLELDDASFAEKVYIVGHSLGAHVAGFVGTDLGGALGRITGLDPAGPFFDGIHARFRLDRTDAQLVDALHSNMGAVLFAKQPCFGSSFSSGHIDLYANDGVHQPGCKHDMLGCSHSKSNKYYWAFLQHELSMRKYLPKKYSPLYRLSAYASDSFQLFANGTSLARRCPSLALTDQQFESNQDLDHCSVPIDYFTWFGDVREELKSRHGIDFDPTSTKSNNYYFLTEAETDDQMDHYVMRAYIDKQTKVQRTQRTVPRECDIAYTIYMDKGMDHTYKLDKYRLLEPETGSYDNIVVPYLSSSLVSKYHIALLDSMQYYLDATDGKTMDTDTEAKIRSRLAEIFPAAIQLDNNGLAEAHKSSNEGFLSKIMNMFNFGSKKRHEEENEEQQRKAKIECNLDVRLFVVRPLRRFHRSMAALYAPTNQTKLRYYTFKERSQLSPKIIVLEEDGKVPIEKSLADLANSIAKSPTSSTSRQLSLHTVIIGPIDRSLTSDTGLEALDYVTVLSQTDSENSHLSLANVTLTTWLVLAGLLVMIIVASTLIISLGPRRVGIVNGSEKTNLSLEYLVNPNHHSVHMGLEHTIDKYSTDYQRDH